MVSMTVKGETKFLFNLLSHFEKLWVFYFGLFKVHSIFDSDTVFPFCHFKALNESIFLLYQIVIETSIKSCNVLNFLFCA